jgi:hypothetical protein
MALLSSKSCVAPSLSRAPIQIQSEYAKAAYAAFIEQAKKIGELYFNLSKEAFKPIEAGIAKVQSGKE